MIFVLTWGILYVIFILVIMEDKTSSSFVFPVDLVFSKLF